MNELRKPAQLDEGNNQDGPIKSKRYQLEGNILPRNLRENLPVASVQYWRLHTDENSHHSFTTNTSIMKQEFVTKLGGDLMCICGNTPYHSGFFPCDSSGKEVEPIAPWKNLYICAECRRIINYDTLEVIKRLTDED